MPVKLPPITEADIGAAAAKAREASAVLARLKAMKTQPRTEENKRAMLEGLKEIEGLYREVSDLLQGAWIN